MNKQKGAECESVNGEEKKLFIETYRCNMTVADSEVVASVMEMNG